MTLKSLYRYYVERRWETPISETLNLAMVSLHDDGRLVIVLEDSRASERPRYQFSFSSVLAYRNTQESYMLTLWQHRAEAGYEVDSSTTLVEPSPWIAELERDEPLLDPDVNHTPLHHFLIATQDDVLEVVTDKYPLIEFVGSGVGSPLAGKSRVYFVPEDGSAQEIMSRSLNELELGQSGESTFEGSKPDHESND